MICYVEVRPDFDDSDTPMPSYCNAVSPTAKLLEEISVNEARFYKAVYAILGMVASMFIQAIMQCK